MATLVVTADQDFRNTVLTDIDIIRFNTSANSEAQFNAGQFGPGLISDTVTVTGNTAFRDVIEVFLTAPSSFSATGWSFVDWTPGNIDDEVRISGSAGDDTITGSDFRDSVRGTTGLDEVFAGDGDDFLSASAGNHVFAGEIYDGGAGIDTFGALNNNQVYDLTETTIFSVEKLRFVLSPTVIASGEQFASGGFNTVEASIVANQTLTVEGLSVDLSAVAFVNWGGGGQVININGTNAISNKLIGSSQNDGIFGVAGAADLIAGGLGRDDLFGDTGDDVFVYAAPNEIAASEVVSGQGGRDTLSVRGAGNFDLRTLAISSVEQLNFFVGGASVTLLQDQIGLGAITVITQSTGVDSLTVQGDSVDLSGLKVGLVTNDALTINGTSSSANTLIGSSFKETINGLGNSVDVMTGGGGADTLNGGNFADTFRYVAGSDAAKGEVVNAGVGFGDTISLVNAGLINFSGVTLNSLERLVYTSGDSSATFKEFGFGFVVGGAGVDTLVLTAQALDLGALSVSSWTNGVDQIIFAGSAAADDLKGTTQNDRFTTSAALDTWDGNGGSDTADYSINIAGVNVTLNGATQVAVSINGVHQDSIRNIENVFGGSAGDTLTGDAFANHLQGNGGADTLGGGGGVDILRGGAGKDNLDGGASGDDMAGGTQDDIYFVDEEDDRVTELAGEGFDAIDTTLNKFSLGANLERVNFVGTGNFSAAGNELANRFAGGGGDDRFVSSLGGDTYGGGLGSDAVDYRDDETGAVLNFKNAVIGGSAAGDSFGSIEKFFGSNGAGDNMVGDGNGKFSFSGFGGNDTLAGANNIDVLQGGAGDDRLIGGAAGDTLQGDAGADTMIGGSAADFFLYVATGFGADSVTDFQDDLDKLKVFSAVADDFADFTISGNGTASVTVSLVASPGDAVTLNAASAITITAADFLFY